MGKKRKKESKKTAVKAPESREERGNRKGGGEEGAEKDLVEILGPEKANAMLETVHALAFVEAVGRCAAIVQRDIRAIRKRNAVTAELIELLVSDPAGFTFAEGAKEMRITAESARKALWRASKRIPWLADLLAERMRLDNARQ